jgi:sulfite oxidase
MISRTALGEKNPTFQIWSEEPVNGEPPLELLGRSLLTPADLFFIRCHGGIPRVEETSYRLVVDGMVEHPLELGLGELREGFPAATVTAALCCAGNRRMQLMEVAEIPGETPWREGAIGNARWTGVPLREVLSAARASDTAQHVALLGLDEAVGEGASVNFGGSIPLEKALSGETLLAYEMNGEPLPIVHGFPLRAIVPGYIGARSVKWLTRITVQREPSDNYFQSRSYKLFAPDVRAGDANWERGLALAEMPVNSAICRPGRDERVEAGTVRIEGWAVTGGNRLVERVDVSADGGGSWREAELVSERASWGWRLWRAALELEPGRYELVARAWDSAATTQPESAAAIWNFKGYANNAWHRVRIIVE